MTENLRAILEMNVSRIRERAAAAAARAGRDPSDIILVAVTKSVDTDVAAELVAAGVADVGENRVQEGERKHAVLGDRCRWHMIGHLQTNKVKKAMAIFPIIHSVDSVRLLREISRRADLDGVSPDIMLEVNVSGEETKHGFEPAELDEAVALACELPGVRLRGLMTMAPYDPDPETARPYFKELARIFRDLRESGRAGDAFDWLSMGMSGDFEVAVEEGATHIRVGTALYDGI